LHEDFLTYRFHGIKGGDFLKASEQYKKLSKEASRLASMANKRIERLERNDLTDSPAFKAWERGGRIRFSVKGKSYNELQREFWRLKNFLSAETSTVRGAINVLKDIADNTGLKYKTIKQLKASAGKFFELSEKVETYYKSIGEQGKSLDYQRIWEQVNTYLNTQKIDLSAVLSIETTLQGLIEQLDKLEPYTPNVNEGFSESGTQYDFIDL